MPAPFRRIVLSPGASEPDLPGGLAAVEDSQLLPGAAPILYLSVEEFSEAVRGLDAEQILQVIQHRQYAFTAALETRSVDYLLDFFARELRIFAELPGSLDRFALTLNRMQLLEGSENFEGCDMEELLDSLAEGESEILNECEGRIAESGAASDSWIEMELQRRARRVRELQRMLGDDEDASFHTTARRGYFVSPWPREQLSMFHLMGDLALPWRDGAMVTWREQEVEPLRTEGRSVTLTYWDAGVLQQDAFDLTPAQLEFRFPERLEFAARPDSFAAHIAQKATVQALRVRAICQHLDRPPIRAMIEDDDATLPRLFALAPPPAQADVELWDTFARQTAVLFARLFPQVAGPFEAVLKDWQGE